MPIADVEPIAHAHGVMAAGRRPIVPGIGFAAGLPLAGDPPAAHLLRLLRVLEVEDHGDVADIALGGRRDIGVAAVEIVAVHALAVGAPFADLARLAGLGHVID